MFVEWPSKHASDDRRQANANMRALQTDLRGKKLTFLLHHFPNFAAFIDDAPALQRKLMTEYEAILKAEPNKADSIKQLVTYRISTRHFHTSFCLHFLKMSSLSLSLSFLVLHPYQISVRSCQ